MESDSGDSEGGGFWLNWLERILAKDRPRTEIKGLGSEGQRRRNLMRCLEWGHPSVTDLGLLLPPGLVEQRAQRGHMSLVREGVLSA